jgi:beta-galactosidase
MTFSIIKDSFYLNGKKVFINSGEIHYFRIKSDLWDIHLKAAVEAGLTTVSTYIPWAWHENEEGVFDFDGTSCPERNLEGWLKKCSDNGLTCIVKPGPFILAEFRGAGLPDWFLDKYGTEVKMRNSKGDIVRSDGVNLFHQKYIEKVSSWYDKILPIIGKHEISSGGPVIMMQICNEIGVFSWLAHQGDYGHSVRERFIAYLSVKFSSVDEINSLWGTTYQTFNNVELPPDGRLPYVSKEDRGRDYEWHCFWRTYYGDYLRMLTGMARGRGVTVPLYHNLPGWIYGNGYEFPLNITMYEDLYGKKSEIIFGVDHIPEFMSYRNLHDDRIINDITVAMQGDKPLFAAEFQCGSREYHVVTNPREMELFYKASVANGLTGWNYYMFSQGRNPSRKGYSGDTFYWFNPLTAEGNRTSAFPLVKRMSRIIKTSEDIIVDAKRKSEVAVLFYPPYYATELERPTDERCGLKFNASSIRRPAYFDGLLKALQVLNIDYDMIDLNSASVDKMKSYKQVWAFSTDEMNAGAQQKIVDYVMTGGNIVIFPCLPDREMSQKQCSIIADSLSISPSGIEVIDSPLIDVFDMKDIKCANPMVTYTGESLTGADIVARTINGTVCGFSKVMGKGSVTHLGTWIGFDTEGHKPVYSALLRRSGAKLKHASSDNDNLAVRERFTMDGSAMLFVGNYYNEEQSGKVTYTHPVTGETISMPYTLNEILIPALYGILTPVCIKVSKGLKILHTTSDVLNFVMKNDELEINLYGDRDLPGEIVFEGEAVNRIISATINGAIAEMTSDRERITFVYSHPHRKEIVLKVKIN